MSTGTENTWIQRLIDVDFSPYILCELGELLCWFDRCSDTQIVHSKHNKRIWFFSTASLSEVYLVLGSFWDLYIPVSCITELSASTCLCVCCVYARRTRWDRQEDTGLPPPKNKKEKKRAREREGKKMPVTLQQTSLRSLDNVDSHTHIHTVASPCSAAECFRGFHCYSLALQTGGIVIYSEGGNEWLRTHVIPPTPHANTIWQHHVSHVKRGGQTEGSKQLGCSRSLAWVQEKTLISLYGDVHAFVLTKTMKLVWKQLGDKFLCWLATVCLCAVGDSVVELQASP